jgi:hypothetical protein
LSLSKIMVKNQIAEPQREILVLSVSPPLRLHPFVLPCSSAHTARLKVEIFF